MTTCKRRRYEGLEHSSALKIVINMKFQSQKQEQSILPAVYLYADEIDCTLKQFYKASYI